VKLARSMPPRDLAAHAYRLYEQFRPGIPEGTPAGSGAPQARPTWAQSQSLLAQAKGHQKRNLTLWVRRWQTADLGGQQRL
jgi:hypothetical protein